MNCTEGVENEGQIDSVLTSIDISISGTQRNQSMPNSAETIIETHTFRPCMLRIPGVLPAEKKIY